VIREVLSQNQNVQYKLHDLLLKRAMFEQLCLNKHKQTSEENKLVVFHQALLASGLVKQI
jgi:hypothetical protein